MGRQSFCVHHIKNECPSKLRLVCCLPEILREPRQKTRKRSGPFFFFLIKTTGSFVIVEASIHGELSMGDQFVYAVIKRATHANVVIPCTHPIAFRDFDASLALLFEISRRISGCCRSEATTTTPTSPTKSTTPTCIST